MYLESYVNYGDIQIPVACLNLSLNYIMYIHESSAYVLPLDSPDPVASSELLFRTT
jgi:hypothetical protein